MPTPTLTQETWKAAVADSGLRLEVLAVATGKSYSAVYRYWTGTRTPSDEWIGRVADYIAAESARRVTR